MHILQIKWNIFKPYKNRQPQTTSSIRHDARNRVALSESREVSKFLTLNSSLSDPCRVLGNKKYVFLMRTTTFPQSEHTVMVWMIVPTWDQSLKIGSCTVTWVCYLGHSTLSLCSGFLSRQNREQDEINSMDSANAKTLRAIIHSQPRHAEYYKYCLSEWLMT